MGLKLKRLRVFLPDGIVEYDAAQIVGLELSPAGAQIAARHGTEIRRYFGLPAEIVDEETLIESAAKMPGARRQ